MTRTLKIYFIEVEVGTEFETKDLLNLILSEIVKIN